MRNTALSGDTRLLGFVYGTQQDFVCWFTRPRGAGANFAGQTALAGGALDWMLGLEQIREATDYGYWDALVARQRTVPALDDRRTHLDNSAAYDQTRWQANAWLQTTAAVWRLLSCAVPALAHNVWLKPNVQGGYAMQFGGHYGKLEAFDPAKLAHVHAYDLRGRAVDSEVQRLVEAYVSSPMRGPH